jgi:hypothetical protein
MHCEPNELTYLGKAAAWYKQGCNDVKFSFRLTETIPAHPMWRGMLTNLFQDLSSDLIRAGTRIRPSTWMGLYRNLVFMQTALWCAVCMRSGTSWWRFLLSMESDRKPSIVRNIFPDALACHQVEGYRQVLEACSLDRWTFEWWFQWIRPYMCGVYRLISFTPRVLSYVLFTFADTVHHLMDIGLLLLQAPVIGFRPVYYRLAYVVSHWLWLATALGAIPDNCIGDRFMQWTVSLIRFSEGCALQAEL